jgi:hypothetical protein
MTSPISIKGNTRERQGSTLPSTTIWLKAADRLAVGYEVRVRASWSPRPRHQQLEPRRRHEIVMTGPGVGVDVTGTPSGRADWLQPDEDHPTELLARKLRDGHPDLAMRSGASIEPGNPTVLATARDGTVVQLRPLRRDERELVARFFAGLSAESRRRRFLQPMPRLPEAMLRRLVDVDGRRHVAVVATVVDECVGIARYVALGDDPGAAEVAVCVAASQPAEQRAARKLPPRTLSPRPPGRRGRR